ncbi:Hypothetical predicted protein [Lecanosticta acicola]|uniref:Small ribosomal subunit protein uS10m n=1 Tax=Lecanosticta acicola TaxID=111012 RepID=A0AAI8YT30_9PEZI|nr:Hypothetical predicted protein [Lecanosticta acicola]
MATTSYSRSLTSAFKRLKLSRAPPAVHQQTRCIEISTGQAAPAISESLPPLQQKPIPASLEQELARIRLPKAVQATYLKPLKHEARHGIVSADLQLRSYSVRNLELYTDFAMRAAYYLGLPAKEPRPLRRIVERYTVPRSNFVHKKSQENFERVTKRRWIRILDGHPEVVSRWLAFLKQYQYYGVGMKCDQWEWGGLDVAKEMNAKAEPLIKALTARRQRKTITGAAKRLKRVYTDRMLANSYKGQWGALAPMSSAQSMFKPPKGGLRRVLLQQMRERKTS